MLSFDYLRESRPWEDLGGWFVDPAVRLPLRMLGACVLFAAITWMFEAVRLDHTQHSRDVAANAYAAQSRLMRDAATYEKRVALLANLDRAIRRSAASGTEVARKLASASRDLPPDAWLTAITPDASGMTLEGVGLNLDAVRRTILGFARDPDSGIPSLQRTDVDESSAGRSLIRFSMRLSFGAP